MKSYNINDLINIICQYDEYLPDEVAFILFLLIKGDMEIKFNAGDKVKLLSGGPDMTIRGVHYDVLSNEYRNDMFDCIWFDKNQEGKKEVHYCPFFAHELVKVSMDFSGNSFENDAIAK